MPNTQIKALVLTWGCMASVCGFAAEFGSPGEMHDRAVIGHTTSPAVIRGRPQAHADIVEQLPSGAELQLVTTRVNASGVWWWARTASNSGWIEGRYVTVTSQTEPPVVIPPASLPSIPTAAVPSEQTSSSPNETSVEESVTGHFGFAAEFGMEFGGDDVADLYYTDGSSSSITTGRGVLIAGGINYRPAHSPWELRGTIGYKKGEGGGDNADVHLGRTLVELSTSYRLSEIMWAGAGYVRHMGMKFSADGLGEDLNFDPANGFFVQLGWKYIAVRYTNLKYTDEFGSKYDANTIGLLFTYGR